MREMIVWEFFLLVYTPIFLYIRCRNFVITAARNEINITTRFYPEHYILPGRRIRKIYNLPKKKIPKFLLVDLWSTLVFIMQCFIGAVWGGIAGKSIVLIIFNVFILIEAGIARIIFTVFTIIYKHGCPKKPIDDSTH